MANDAIAVLPSDSYLTVLVAEACYGGFGTAKDGSAPTLCWATSLASATCAPNSAERLRTRATWTPSS